MAWRVYAGYYRVYTGLGYKYTLYTSTAGLLLSATAKPCSLPLADPSCGSLQLFTAVNNHLPASHVCGCSLHVCSLTIYLFTDYKWLALRVAIRHTHKVWAVVEERLLHSLDIHTNYSY